jgi:hypothetical protein
MARIDITARIETEGLAKTLARLSAHDIPIAIRAGIRDAASGARTQLAKGIRERYSLSSGRIKQDVSQAQFIDGGMAAVIRTSRKPITAMQFKPRQTRKGLSMSIFRGERTVVKSGFMAKGLPFKRRTKARYPLDVIHGPSIHAIYTGGRHADALQARVEDVVAERLEKGIMRRLRALGRGYG